MNSDKDTLLLYAVTDRKWTGRQTLAEQVESALKGGATFVQLREKTLDYDAFLEEAKIIKEICGRYNVPFVINDNVDIAIAADADGVHVGQDDMDAGSVRKKLGADKIIGVSAQTVEQAVLAEKNGADYLGVGAVFPTESKDDAAEVTKETLAAICKAVSIPVVAIGGVSQSNVHTLEGSGIVGIAVISAIFGQDDIESATAELKKAVSAIV
jgi:thiamine-phosphate pyrophosphorylase